MSNNIDKLISKHLIKEIKEWIKYTRQSGIKPINSNIKLESPTISDLKIKNNKIPVYKPSNEYIYDLHGLTINEAFNFVISNIEKAYSNNEDEIVFITGKSNSSKNKSTIKKEIKFWLDNSKVKTMVRSFRNAAMKKGGDGVLIIKLNKNNG